MHSIPPRLLPPELTTPIRSAADMLRQWSAFMGPLGFSGRSLWFILLTSEGVLTPAIGLVEDIPLRPTPRMARNLAQGCKQALAAEIDPEGSAAFLLSRPGRGRIIGSDRAWGQALTQEAARARLDTWPFCVATDEAVMPLDDLPMAA